MAAFLTLGYLPEPLTVTPTARALPAGTFVRVRTGRARTESFWDHASVQPSVCAIVACGPVKPAIDGPMNMKVTSA